MAFTRGGNDRSQAGGDFIQNTGTGSIITRGGNSHGIFIPSGLVRASGNPITTNGSSYISGAANVTHAASGTIAANR
jgi:hypothetical protein